MPFLHFLTLDVFTTTRYLGNPLAIVRIPHGHPSPPTQEQKQAIAKEFNLSETIFLHENSEVSAGADNDVNVQEKKKGGGEEIVKIEIFTSDQELPFAGHPTVGAGFYLHNLRAAGRPRPLALLTKAGKIPVHRLQPNPSSSSSSPPNTTIPFAALQVPHSTHLHKAELVSKEILLLFPAIPHNDYHLELCSIPVFSIVKGMTFALPRLSSLEALSKVIPNSPRLVTPELDSPWDGGLVGVYFYVVIGREEEKAEEHERVAGNDGADADTDNGGDSKTHPTHTTTWKWHLRTRMILGLLEDPATGSASCALSAYLALSEGGRKGVLKHRFEIVQGVEMGRRSVIGVEVVLREKDNGEKEVDKVVLSGSAVKVMEGVVEY